MDKVKPDWLIGFYSALAVFVNKQTGHLVTEVFDFEEESFDVGGCETCSSTEYEVTVYYKTPDTAYKYYTYTGKFADLLNELT